MPYPKAAREQRHVLEAEFGPIYERLCAALHEHLGGTSVELAPGPQFSVPAFHVIPSHLAWSYPVFRAHLDESFTTLLTAMNTMGGAPAELGDTSLCDQESRISFTLPLALPDTVSGLNYIDYEWEDCPHRNDPNRKYLCGKMNREVYEVGTLVVHSHALLHQIGEWSYSSWDSNRITLQGFGFQCSGKWWLYW